MASERMDDDVVAVITWAIDRILNNNFEEVHDAAGNLESLVLDKDFNPSNAPIDRNVETKLATGVPMALPLFTARRYAKEIRDLFPKMVRRDGSLRLLPTAMEVPEYVRRYMIEASRCYIYGHFLASLFLCRSALGEAVVVALRKKGCAKDLADLKEMGLKGIFRLARDKGLMDETLHHQADDVRVLANQAIQGSKLPTDDECKSAFDLTRGILEHFYA